MHARPMRSRLLRGGPHLPRRAWLSFILPAARRSQLRYGGGLHARRSHTNLLPDAENGGTGRAGGAFHRARKPVHGHPRGPHVRVRGGHICRGRGISRPRAVLRGRVHCRDLRGGRRRAPTVRNGLLRPRPSVLYIARPWHALRVYVRGFVSGHTRRRGLSGSCWLHAVTTCTARARPSLRHYAHARRRGSGSNGLATCSGNTALRSSASDAAGQGSTAPKSTPSRLASSRVRRAPVSARARAAALPSVIASPRQRSASDL